MRRKKHLEQRLQRAVEDGLLIDIKLESLRFDETEGTPLNLQQLFGNSNPVYLEIGCGKGSFAVQHAQRYPEINLIAIEKSSNVVVEACEAAAAAGVRNLRFMDIAAQYLPRYLPKSSIGRIYLNFSCPFQKTQYACHRLTNPLFLRIYRDLLCVNGQLHQKTDNTALFDYSLESLQQCGWRVLEQCRDIYAGDLTDNLQTEYESRFAAQNKPICRLTAYPIINYVWSNELEKEGTASIQKI